MMSRIENVVPLRIAFTLCCLLAPKGVCAQELTQDMAEDVLRRRERFWESIADTEPPGGLGVRALFDHAFELAE